MPTQAVATNTAIIVLVLLFLVTIGIVLAKNQWIPTTLAHIIHGNNSTRLEVRNDLNRSRIECGFDLFRSVFRVSKHTITVHDLAMRFLNLSLPATDPTTALCMKTHTQLLRY
jgi:hypothetical protein